MKKQLSLLASFLCMFTACVDDAVIEVEEETEIKEISATVSDFEEKKTELIKGVWKDYLHEP